MKKNLAGTLVTLAILLTFTPHLLQAKGKGASQWFLTPRIGAATMIGEVNSSFTAVENDFNHGLGISADLALSRTFGSHFEVGLGVEFYKLSNSDDSLFITDLKAFEDPQNPLHSSFAGIYYYGTIPVEYKTTSISPKLFLRYYFKQFSDDQRFQPYAELNIGQTFFSPELNYVDTTNIITDPKPEQLPSVWIPGPNNNNYQAPYESNEKALKMTLGLGTRLQLNGGMTLNLAAELSHIATEFMDGAPNPMTDQVKGTLISRFLFGVVIPIGSAGHSSRNKHLPWAPN